MLKFDIAVSPWQTSAAQKAADFELTESFELWDAHLVHHIPYVNQLVQYTIF